MHRRPPARPALAVVILAVALLTTGAWVPARAHTEVLRASPSPGEQLTGTVDRVELTFLDPVRADVTITVERASGEPIEGVGQVALTDDRRTATVTVPALTDAGDYVVEYHFTADDGDTQRETYRFTLLPSPDGGESGAGDGALVGAVALGVVVVAAAVASFLRRRRSD